MLSCINEYYYNLEPLGIFCLRVTFYFTADTDSGSQFQRAGGLVMSFKMFSASHCTRPTVWPGNACKL